MNFAISLFAYSLLLMGLKYRRRSDIHMKFMLSAFAVDMALLLYIELSRKAVETAMEPMHPFVLFHVVISVLAVLLYFVQIFIGFRLLKGKFRAQIHKRVGMTFMFFRSLNLVTSFFVADFVAR